MVERIAPLVAEAMMRAVRGEPELAQGIKTEAILGMMTTLIQALASEMRLTDAQIETWVAEAEDFFVDHSEQIAGALADTCFPVDVD